MRVQRPLDALLARTVAETGADGVITQEEATTLERLATDSQRSTLGATPALQAVLNGAARFDTPATRAQLESLVGVGPSPLPRPTNDLVHYEAPENHNVVRSHQLYVKRDGVLRTKVDSPGYSRGWGQFSSGVLEKAHGSEVPASSVHDLSTRATLNALPPSERLNAAARAYGVDLPYNDFSSIARSFVRPDEPYWAGVCYSWSWAALDARLSTLVDVEGAPGERGLWIGGQFLSRADLGNWLMALSAGLSQSAGDIMWYNPEAEDLLKAAVGYLVDGSAGFRADIGNAYDPTSNQVWFQPFLGADTKIESLSDATAAQILDVAREPRRAAWGGSIPGHDGSEVKLIRIDADFGNEAGDGWENAPEVGRIGWAMYAVLGDDGKVLTAIMADDPRLEKVQGLPVNETAAVPRQLFAPRHDIIDDLLAGEASPVVDGSVYGPALRFFVGHVLAQGVPASTRRAFENERVLVGNGPLAPSAIADLEARYPTVANAFSPEEWSSRFAGRGLVATDFGATYS